MNIPYYLSPLGAYQSILENPISKKSVEVAVFHEHRIAFYYWALWTIGVKFGRSITPPPILVSFDWHEDIAAPNEDERRGLEKLNIKVPGEVAYFSWAMLDPHNDGHILCAAYINLISDIFIVRKQNRGIHPPLTDMYGRTHQIYCFDDAGDMFNTLIQHQGVDKVYFDIDLDYFTDSPAACGGGPQLKLVSAGQIEATVNPQSDLRLVRPPTERVGDQMPARRAEWQQEMP